MGQATNPYDAGPGSAQAGAALTLMEALLLVLVDRKILRKEDVDAVFEAAIGAHEVEAGESGMAEAHAKISRVLKRLHSQGNAVRLE